MAIFSVKSTACCGIKELSNISALPTPEGVVQETVSAIKGIGPIELPPAFLMFSGVVGNRVTVYGENWHANRADDYGQALADYITAKDLGTVTVTPPARNYSGNMLRVWLWAPKWDTLRAIYYRGAVPTSPPSTAAATSPITVASVEPPPAALRVDGVDRLSEPQPQPPAAPAAPPAGDPA